MVVRAGLQRRQSAEELHLWTVVLEKTPESPLDSKEIKPVNLKGNQPWILFGRTDAEGEPPVFWWSDGNSWLIGKVPDTGKDWGQKEKRVSEDEMAGWHHWCNGHELGQILGDGEGQRGLVCCSPWGRKELDMSGWLNKFSLVQRLIFISFTQIKNNNLEIAHSFVEEIILLLYQCSKRWKWSECKIWELARLKIWRYWILE